MTLAEVLRARPFGLALSSGFFGFYAHAGFLAAIEEAGLSPTLVTGSSAGALAGGTWASGVSAGTLARTLGELAREDFWDPSIGLGLLRGKLFASKLEELLPIRRFEQAVIPMALSVFDVWKRRTTVRSSGIVNDVIRASCALPMMFQPVWLDRRPHLDGGIKDRPGIAGQPDDMLVLAHHLESSVLDVKPKRLNTVTLVVKGLPRVTPFALTRGAHAFHTAYEGARRVLREPFVIGERRV